MIFDFDGLLMDTESTNFASWAGEWEEWGLVLDREAFFVPHGGDVTELRYELLAAAVGDSFDRTLSHARRSARGDALNAALQLAAGIDSWLIEAAEHGIVSAVASSSDVAWVARHLEQVAVIDRFDVIVGETRSRHTSRRRTYTGLLLEDWEWRRGRLSRSRTRPTA